MTVPVAWLKGRALCWDQELLNEWLSGPNYTHHDEIPDDTDGCVLVVPARYLTPAAVNVMLAPLTWCVVVLTSDEESTFDHTALQHPNMALWVMTPRPGQHEPGPRFLGEGCRADTSAVLANHASEAADRPLDVFFAGQITHERRQACAEGIQALTGDVRTEFLPTEGFLQGIDRDEYLAVMAATKIAPCPSGPATPDSFRLYEALEAGALPIADGTCPAEGFGDGYWHLLFGEAPPFPIIDDWTELPKYVEHALSEWPGNATRAQAWWLGVKRRTAKALLADAARVSGCTPAPLSVDDRITVLIPTSPIPAHPSTEIIGETIASVRALLPTAEIIVMCDGVRPQQAARRRDYAEYLRALVWRCAHEWENVTPLIVEHHAHQANLTRAALELVDTPLVLFVEHDTPICGPIPFGVLADAVESGAANLVRFHHEAHVLAVHQHLMLDREPQEVCGVPLLRTAQWSQRPHLASAGFYRTLIGSYFGTKSRTMIEDVMHGVVDQAFRRHGAAGWQQFRLWMYAPTGDMKRSLHLDGRQDDPKFDMVYAYDGPTPEGAPAP